MNAFSTTQPWSIASQGAEVDGASPAVFLIDAERRLVDMGGGAAVLVERGVILTCCFGRLDACCQRDGIELTRAMQAAMRQGAATARLSDGAMEAEIVRMGEVGQASARFLLLVRDLAAGEQRAVRRAAERFGLTAAEGRLLAHLLDGLALKEAARRLGVANTTARTHLQKIFDKTGVRCQTELQRMAARHVFAPGAVAA